MTEQERFDERSQKDQTSTPKPDPTALTSEALKDAIGSLRTLIDQRINATEQLVDTKILLGREGGMALKELLVNQISELKDLTAEARSKLAAEIARSEQLHAGATDRLRSEVAEKFHAVQIQFDLMEGFRVEQKHDTQAAVDAALAAAKEAVQQQTIASDRSITKSETATSEQLKQMNVTTSTAIQGLNLIIDDVKERISRMESYNVGARSSTSESRDTRADSRGNMALVVSASLAVLTILVLILSQLHIAGH